MLADAPWTTWHEISWSPQDIVPAGMNVLLANAECRNPLAGLRFPPYSKRPFDNSGEVGYNGRNYLVGVASIASVYTLARKDENSLSAIFILSLLGASPQTP